MVRSNTVLVLMAAGSLLSQVVQSGRADDAVATDYDTFDQAVESALGFYRVRNYGACKVPLEAALELASSDQKRADVHLMLINAYAETGDAEKMCVSADFAIENMKGRSSIFLLHPGPASTLARAAGRKGKVRFVKERYQKQLEDDPQNVPALVILSSLASDVDRDPVLQVKYLQQLLDIQDKNTDLPVDPKVVTDLARAYARTKDGPKAAVLFERAAELDEAQKTHHLKDAAKAWVDAGEMDKAVATARKAVEVGPDTRSELLTHFWHRGIGQVFLAAKKRDEAVEHLQKAVETTKIDGYKKDSQAELDEAKRLPK